VAATGLYWLRDVRATVGNTEDADWSNDILHLLLAEIRKGEIDFIAYLIADDPADANPARLRQGLQSRRDVHPVAEDVLIGDHIPEIDADAELDPLLRRGARVALAHSPLHLHRGPHRVHDSRELGKEAVAGVLDDAAAVFGDLRLDQLPKVRFDPFVRPSSSAPIRRE
jgi:hypothetical protein